MKMAKRSRRVKLWSKQKHVFLSNVYVEVLAIHPLKQSRICLKTDPKGISVALSSEKCFFYTESFLQSSLFSKSPMFLLRRRHLCRKATFKKPSYPPKALLFPFAIAPIQVMPAAPCSRIGRLLKCQNKAAAGSNAGSCCYAYAWNGSRVLLPYNRHPAPLASSFQ